MESNARTLPRYVRICLTFWCWLGDVAKDVRTRAQELTQSAKVSGSAFTPLLWALGTSFSATIGFSEYAPKFVWIPASMSVVLGLMFIGFFPFALFFRPQLLQPWQFQLTDRQIDVDKEHMRLILEDSARRALLPDGENA